MITDEQLLERSLARTAKRLGVEVGELQWAYEEQEGICKICKDKLSRGVGGLVVDYDYNAGCLRGFLCRKCKTGVASFKESVTALKAAIDYLNVPRI